MEVADRRTYLPVIYRAAFATELTADANNFGARPCRDDATGLRARQNIDQLILSMEWIDAVKMYRLR